MNKNLINLLQILKPNKIAENTYSASSLNRGLRCVYGGQLLAQASYVAFDVMPKDKKLYANFANFLNPVQSDYEIIYKANILKLGNSFNVCNVEAYQNNLLMFNLNCSFQVEEHSLSHDTTAFDLDIEKNLINENDFLKNNNLPEQMVKAMEQLKVMFPFLIKIQYINNPFHGIQYPPKQCLYIQVPDLSENYLDNLLLLNYLADYNFLPTALHPHKKGFLQKNMTVATLNHAQWFHREILLNKGIFHSMESPILQNNRGLVTGKFIDTTGKLVSSTNQEGLIRYSDTELL